MRKNAPLTIALFAACASVAWSPCVCAQKTEIKRRRDVLHGSLATDSTVTNLADRLIGEGATYLLVNPKLKADEGDEPTRELESAFRAWTDGGPALPEAVVNVLCRPVDTGKPSAMYDALFDLSRDFVGTIFRKCDDSENLERLVLDAGTAKLKWFVLFSVDAQCRPGPRTNTIEVAVSMRVHRITITTGDRPFRVERAELLYQDRATGTAALKTIPERSTTEADADAIADAFKSAVVDAFARKIGHSLVANARNNSESWVDARNVDVVDASLNGSKKPGTDGGER